MNLRIAAIVVLAVTSAFGQEKAPAAAQAAFAPQATHQPMPTQRWGNGARGNKQTAAVNAPSLQQRVQDLQGTADKMHVVLKQMHAKSASSPKDPIVKANLEMWDLMVKQLDEQLQDLKQAEARREDMETRRAALYKQADAKVEAEAQAARAAQAAKFAARAQTSAPAAEGSGQSPAGQTAPGQLSTPPVNNSPSPK